MTKQWKWTQSPFTTYEQECWLREQFREIDRADGFYLEHDGVRIRFTVDSWLKAISDIAEKDCG